MKLIEIKSYEEFIGEVEKIGFGQFGEDREGIFKFRLNGKPSELENWESKALEEKRIVIAKLFFGKKGYVSKELYPYFFRLRRDLRNAEEAYNEGIISRQAKKVYDIISSFERGVTTPEICRIGGFGKEEKAMLDSDIEELQMKMYITMCSEDRKISLKGYEYKMARQHYCDAEKYFSEDVFEKALKMTKKEAEEMIMRRILDINPYALKEDVERYIYGN
ncbi:MAG: hypothetical protein J5874_04405 [Oscillospiraceae bacterium]|nr:hypothetical protein [Oscillospiraceae bacterium]